MLKRLWRWFIARFDVCWCEHFRYVHREGKCDGCGPSMNKTTVFAGALYRHHEFDKPAGPIKLPWPDGVRSFNPTPQWVLDREVERNG